MTGAPAGEATRDLRQLPAAGELPRLLAGIPPSGHLMLDEHERLRGSFPIGAWRPRGRGRRQANPLIEEIEAAGLRGRGGAAFAAAAKLRAGAQGRGRAVVVANGAEGEPASGKDRTLLEMQPHLVLDGAQLAAEAVGATEIVVAVCETADDGLRALTSALEERAAAYDPRDCPAFSVATVPSHYVAGQETALVGHLNGGPAIPAFTPPRVFEAGVARRPTLVNNVETLAHIGMIGRFGAAWFRGLGTAAEPGSALVTISGPVAAPGVYEIELGATLGSLVDAAGGLSEGVQAALIGGYAGSWIGGSDLRSVRLSDEFLAGHEASLGAGIVVLLSEAACPVVETARLARWLAGQSTRQCGPCLHGLDAVADTLESLTTRSPRTHAGARVAGLAALTARRGACSHPDGALRPALSALRAFAEDVADHTRHGGCDNCARAPELALPLRPVDLGRRARTARR